MTFRVCVWGLAGSRASSVPFTDFSSSGSFPPAGFESVCRPPSFCSTGEGRIWRGPDRARNQSVYRGIFDSIAARANETSTTTDYNRR